MAFITGSNTVIDNYAALIHNSFESASSDTQSTQIKITASDPGTADSFGSRVAVGSGRIVIGAQGDSDNGIFSGSAYIFNLNGTQLAKIKPADGAAGEFFGEEVAVGSGRIVIGTYLDADNGIDSGSAYLYDLNGNQIAKIKPADGAAEDRFGNSVAVGSGRIVIGANQDDDNGLNSGSAYIFNLSGTQLIKIKPSDGIDGDNFGISVAIATGRIVVGSHLDDDNGSNSGSAYIFDLNGNQLAKIKPSDGEAGDQFGLKVSVGSGRIVIGSRFDDDNGSDSGSAYIFDLNGNQIAKIKPSDGAANDEFGAWVSVGSGRIVVGAPGDDDNGTDSGSAYVFDLNGNQIAKIKPSDGAAGDTFGLGLAIGYGRIVVGAPGDDDNASDAGSAYIYKLQETSDTYFEKILDTFNYNR